MKTLDLVQDSPEWHAHRATARNASDAPAALGCSPHQTRSQLLHARHTGLRAEVDAATQRRFDDGHAIEAAQLPGAEEVIGQDLYPAVGVETVDGMELSASFDGITMDESTAYECKTINGELRSTLSAIGGIEANDGRLLPKHYRVQMEQQLMVCAGERVLFVAADADGNDVRRCWYTSDPALRAEILAAWRQFDIDLAAYQPTEAAPVVTAAPIEALPAVSVQMQGSLTVHSNLDVFGKMLREFVAGIPAKPSTEQEFADCDAACKALKRAEEALDGAEANALGQVQSVEQITRTIADLRTVARTARLASEKMVKARKEQLRTEEVQRGREALSAHVAGLNATIGKPYMPSITADFAGTISGKKTVDSVRNAIDTELARAKIAANEVHSTILVNMAALRELAAEHVFLFADTASLVLKAPDDCRAQITSRIGAHKDAEAKREEETRERIRQEEVAKLQREQEAREREAARQAAEAAKPAPTPAPAAIAAPAPVSQAPKVVPMGTRAPAAEPATLKLGEINSRLGFTMTAEFVATSLGITGQRERGAVLFKPSDYDRIRAALVQHIEHADHAMAA